LKKNARSNAPDVWRRSPGQGPQPSRKHRPPLRTDAGKAGAQTCPERRVSLQQPRPGFAGDGLYRGAVRGYSPGDAAGSRSELPEALAKAPSAGALTLKNHFAVFLQRGARARLRRDEPAITACPQPVPSGFCQGGLRRHFVLRCVAFPWRPSPLRRRPPSWRPLLL
jgi:hypothetical protein